MARISESFAPYTSIGNILLILKRIRKGWVPVQIDKGEMLRAGITAGNSGRTIAALQYLGLTNEDGKTTDTWKAIATSTTNDYPKVLEGIIRNSYPSIFELNPTPSDATDVDISNAFSKSEPLNQRARMVTLFRGLCQEAGLIAGDPLIRKRKPVVRKKNIKIKENEGDGEIEAPAIRYAPLDKINPSLKWYKNLDTLMSRLPDPENAQWTKVEKEKWLNALQSMLDLLIDVSDEGGD